MEFNYFGFFKCRGRCVFEIVARRLAFEGAMRKLLRGGQVSIIRAFADNNVERVLLHSSLHADSVSHSVSSSSPPKVFKLKERAGRAGASIRASNGAGSYAEHFATLGLSAAASKQEIKTAYRKLALQVINTALHSSCCVFVRCVKYLCDGLKIFTSTTLV